MGAPYLFRGRTSTRLRLVTGSNAHQGVCIWVPIGHPLQHVQKGTLWVITLWVNFGQNYRDLGHFVRVTFYGQITGTLSGTHMCTTFRGPLFSSWSHHVLPSATLRGPQWVPIDPGGIEPQPIKLEFTIYPAELWI